MLGNYHLLTVAAVSGVLLRLVVLLRLAVPLRLAVLMRLEPWPRLFAVWVPALVPVPVCRLAGAFRP